MLVFISILWFHSKRTAVLIECSNKKDLCDGLKRKTIFHVGCGRRRHRRRRRAMGKRIKLHIFLFTFGQRMHFVLSMVEHGLCFRYFFFYSLFAHCKISCTRFRIPFVYFRFESYRNELYTLIARRV